MQHPLLYEVNARQWLADLAHKHGRDIDLYAVPEGELDQLERRGFTHLWLMGVWPTGPRSREQAVTHPDLRKSYDDALPGWSDEDVLGSPYAVGALHVSPLLGGDAGLSALRERLAERDIKLILDFVPNHLGLDHAWVLSRPELFVGLPHQFPDSFPLKLPSGTRYVAHGKDPFFPGWTDTVQLDYRRPETRQAMRDLLRSVSDRCDGVRCDMAMLVLADVFQNTWRHVPVDVDHAAGEFWHDAIGNIKKEREDFLFLAEAYWDLEGRLCDLGFDYAYDKKLYDLLVHDHAWDVQPHLLGLAQQNARRAHFLENHDEPRVAGLV
ncbi:MAG TPA: alpha-amylase family glycosyl hydrolase, partial [Myxococcota bacterium]